MAGSFSPGAYMTHGAIDASHTLWFTSNNGNDVARVNSSTAAPITGFPINATTNTAGCPSSIASTISGPQQPAIDASGNAWIPLSGAISVPGTGSTVLKVTPAGACTTYTVGTGPYGATIDGANNLWVTNSKDNTITELSTATGTAISPSTAYTVGGLLSGPQGLSVDLSGDLIITNHTGNSIVEVIGAATPTYLPLGLAATNGKLGAKP
jgi:streptogramin lyase